MTNMLNSGNIDYSFFLFMGFDDSTDALTFITVLLSCKAVVADNSEDEVDHDKSDGDAGEEQDDSGKDNGNEHDDSDGDDGEKQDDSDEDDGNEHDDSDGDDGDERDDSDGHGIEYDNKEGEMEQDNSDERGMEHDISVLHLVMIMRTL